MKTGRVACSEPVPKLLALDLNPKWKVRAQHPSLSAHRNTALLRSVWKEVQHNPPLDNYWRASLEGSEQLLLVWRQVHLNESQRGATWSSRLVGQSRQASLWGTACSTATSLPGSAPTTLAFTLGGAKEAKLPHGGAPGQPWLKGEVPWATQGGSEKSRCPLEGLGIS